MRVTFTLAKVLLSAGAVTLVFSLNSWPHDVAKVWRCRPDDRATSYERADACRPENWR